MFVTTTILKCVHSNVYILFLCQFRCSSNRRHVYLYTWRHGTLYSPECEGESLTYTHTTHWQQPDIMDCNDCHDDSLSVGGWIAIHASNHGQPVSSWNGDFGSHLVGQHHHTEIIQCFSRWMYGRRSQTEQTETKCWQQRRQQRTATVWSVTWHSNGMIACVHIRTQPNTHIKLSHFSWTLCYVCVWLPTTWRTSRSMWWLLRWYTKTRVRAPCLRKA